MCKFIIFLFGLIATTAKADSCDIGNFPIKWQDTLYHASSYSTPAIFYKSNNSRVIVSVKDAILYIKDNMSEHKAFLKKAKYHIIDSLKRVDKSKVIDYSSLLISLEGLGPEELNVGIHVMSGYQGIFEGTLLNKTAAVEIDGNLVSQTNGKYTIGKDPAPVHGLDFVHRLTIGKQDNVVFKKCWMDSK